MSSNAPLNTHDAKKQADNNTKPSVLNLHAVLRLVALSLQPKRRDE